jgi:hypothetical protein
LLKEPDIQALMALPILPRSLPLVKPSSSSSKDYQSEYRVDDHVSPHMIHSCNNALMQNCRNDAVVAIHAMQAETFIDSDDRSACSEQQQFLELAKWFVTIYGPVYETTMQQSLPDTFFENLLDRIQSYIDELSCCQRKDTRHNG